MTDVNTDVGKGINKTTQENGGVAPDAPIEDAVENVMNGHDPVNHPQHYRRNPAGIEVIDIVEHLNFNMGNAVKCILRADAKGDFFIDMEKAIWYLNREIERRDKHPNTNIPR